MLYIIGEQFGDVSEEICGAVISVRYNEDILAVWNRNADNASALRRIRDGITKVLKLPNWVRVEYKSHDSAMQDKSSFRNTNVWRGDQRSDRRNQRSGPPPGHYGGHNLRHDRDDGWGGYDNYDRRDQRERSGPRTDHLRAFGGGSRVSRGGAFNGYGREGSHDAVRDGPRERRGGRGGFSRRDGSGGGFGRSKGNGRSADSDSWR